MKPIATLAALLIVGCGPLVQIGGAGDPRVAAHRPGQRR